MRTGGLVPLALALAICGCASGDSHRDDASPTATVVSEELPAAASTLELRPVLGDADPSGCDPTELSEVPVDESPCGALLGDAVLTSSDVASVSETGAGTGVPAGTHLVELALNESGRRRWVEVAAERSGRELAVVLDGFVVYSARVPPPADTDAVIRMYVDGAIAEDLVAASGS